MSNASAEGLTRRLSEVLRKRITAPGITRHSGRDIARQALLDLIRKEMLSGLAAFFGGDLRKHVERRIPDSQEDKIPQSKGAHGGGLPPYVPGQNGGCFDQRQMEFSIDQMVAASLTHGRQTSIVLRALFGLVPSLIGR